MHRMPCGIASGPSSRGSLTALVLLLALVAPVRADGVVNEKTVSDDLSGSGDGTTITALLVAGDEGRQAMDGGSVPVRIAFATDGAGSRLERRARMESGSADAMAPKSAGSLFEVVTQVPSTFTPVAAPGAFDPRAGLEKVERKTKQR